MTTGDRVIAVDPGREKCGLALVDRRQGVLARTIVLTDRLPAVVEEWASKQDCRIVVLGDQTSSKAAKLGLQPLLAAGKLSAVESVDERNSSEEARRRYWQDNPPTGWRRRARASPPIFAAVPAS